MSGRNNQSEVAFLMAQFAAEHQSAEWALTGIASGVTRHDFISARMDRMGQIGGALKELVGEDEAGKLMVEEMEK
jgi:hypothetical protein